jgi:chromosome segregation ATPase
MDGATIVAGVTAAGVVLAGLVAGVFGVIHLRTRKPSDARDDRTAEVATAKSAAEVAMELVETTKTWALEMIGLLRAENAALVAKVATLEIALHEARIEIDRLRGDAGGHSAQLAAAREREVSLQRELASAIDSKNRLQATLDAAEARGIEDLTLTPESVQRHRDRMDTGPTPHQGEQNE